MFNISNRFVLREEAGSEGSDDGGFTAEQFKELQTENESMKAQNQSMQGKMDELLGETKRAKAASREAKDVATAAAHAKAQKDGDFEQLYKSSQEQANAFKSELESLNSNIASERQGSAAMKIASSLADGPNAEILATFIKGRLRYTDDGMKVLDANGQLTVSSNEELAAEFQNNARYASLLRGNQSSGGSATGGSKSSGAASKTLTRSEFDSQTPMKKMEFIKLGGNITQ